MTDSNDYLKTKEVQEEYGYSRSSLLRYESDGLIHPSYSPGGQRRYLRADIERLRINPSEAQAAETMPYREFGSAGFSKWASKPYDEKFRELRGRAGLSLYREMRLNDPVISAIFTAIENALRRPTWRVSPVSQAEGDIQAAEFVNQNMEDMSWSWSDTLSFILQCLEQGYSVLEVIYKKRLGENPPPYVADPGQSLYNDNRVGWRKWAPRPAETLVENDEFIIDEHGSIQGINQEQPDRSIVQIPIKRLLHFRTTVIPANNPKGLALALNTPIPTPNGWTTMKDIQIGDKVYDRNGRIRYVTWKSEVWQDRPAYEIEINGGKTIVADENHLWFVTSHNDRQKNRGERVMTTKELFNWHEKDTWESKRGLSLGETPVLDALPCDLPIDPYILGYWLGDGTSRQGSIAVHPSDYKNLEYNAIQAGYKTSYNGYSLAILSGLKTQLRELNLIGNKHIPAIYLRAHPSQRLALLQGLMDSDGCNSVGHYSIFTNTNNTIVDNAIELIKSLGGRPSKRVSFASRENYSKGLNRIIFQRKDIYVV